MLMRLCLVLCILLAVTATSAQETPTITALMTQSEPTAASTATAMKRCVGLYQAYGGGVRTAQLPKTDIWRTMKRNGPKFLYQAAQLEALPDFEETLRQVTQETTRLGEVYTDLMLLNLDAGKPAVDEFIAADLEFCHVYSLTLPSLTELLEE